MREASIVNISAAWSPSRGMTMPSWNYKNNEPFYCTCSHWSGELRPRASAAVLTPVVQTLLYRERRWTLSATSKFFLSPLATISISAEFSSGGNTRWILQIFTSSSSASARFPWISRAQHCKTHARVRAATDAQTSVAARNLSNPIFVERPARKSLGFSPLIRAVPISSAVLLQSSRTKPVVAL